MISNEVITKLLKSKLVDDNLLGLEYQYNNFKHGYTNWYRRKKYNREFRKRIAALLDYEINPRHNFDQAFMYLQVQTIKVYDWFKARLEEDFNNKML